MVQRLSNNLQRTISKSQIYLFPFLRFMMMMKCIFIKIVSVESWVARCYVVIMCALGAGSSQRGQLTTKTQFLQQSESDQNSENHLFWSTRETWLMVLCYSIIIIIKGFLKLSGLTLEQALWPSVVWWAVFRQNIIHWFSRRISIVM